MFNHLPQNQTRIFSSVTRKDARSVMDKTRSLVEKYQPLVNHYPDDVWDIMDCHNRFIYANNNLNRIVGLDSTYDFEGRYMAEPPAACYDICADEFIEQNDTCVHTQQDMKVLDIHPGMDGEWFVYIFHKKPIFEGEEVVGTLHHGYSVLTQWKESVSVLQKASRFYTGTKEISVMIKKPDDFSDEQSEVLFFLLCNKDPKEIARILNIDVQAIYKRIVRLKEKFGVNSINQIIDAAIASDLHKRLPPRLAGKHLSLILDK